MHQAGSPPAEGFARRTDSPIQTKMRKTIRRRTQIEIETHEITLIRTSGRRSTHYCERCRRTVVALEAEGFAELLKQKPEEIDRRVQADSLHLVNTRPGNGIICGNSAGGVSEQLGAKTKGEKNDEK